MKSWLTHTSIGVLHGFTTRIGGVSHEPFASLNLGLSSGDEPELVESNRDWLLEQLGLTRENVAAYNQVHGATVATGEPGWFNEDADAATTNTPGVMLVMSVADCLPIVLHDPLTGAVAAIHAGWRGTVAGVAEATVNALKTRYGTEERDVVALLGPAISVDRYEVGPEVVAAARAADLDGAIQHEQPNGHAHFDVRKANAVQLARAGVRHIHHLAHCTASEPDLFYSYRRDKGTTGRHWAFVQRSE